MSFEAVTAHFGVPNDQVGDHNSLGWAGLYVRSEGGEIVVDQHDELTVFEYASESEMREAWHEFERTFEIKKPDHDDYVLVQQGSIYLVYSFVEGTQMLHAVSGARKEIRTRDDAVAWCKERMERENFFPDIWEVIAGQFLLLGE